MPLAIEPDHSSFPVVPDRRCAHSNEARRREARVEQERVNDTRARCDLSLVARLGGHSAPRTHRDQVRFFSHDHHSYVLIQMVGNVGSLTCVFAHVCCSLRGVAASE